MTRRVWRDAALALGLALVAAFAPPPTLRAQNAATVPWATGEYLEYSLKFGPISAGTGRMMVVGTDTARGRQVWHLRFNISGGTFFYKVNDSYDSFLDRETLNSLRFQQSLSEGNRDRERTYEIYPDRKIYVEQGKPERPSVESPLDDASFFYFLRTVPLEVGKRYEFNRYYNPDANPVVIEVLRKEAGVSVPAGRFDTIVIRPIIKTSGIFSEGGRAEIWLSDDNRRMLVQMKTKLPFGSLNLYLRKMQNVPPVTKQDTAVRQPAGSSR